MDAFRILLPLPGILDYGIYRAAGLLAFCTQRAMVVISILRGADN